MKGSAMAKASRHEGIAKVYAAILCGVQSTHKVFDRSISAPNMQWRQAALAVLLVCNVVIYAK